MELTLCNYCNSYDYVFLSEQIIFRHVVVFEFTFFPSIFVSGIFFASPGPPRYGALNVPCCAAHMTLRHTAQGVYGFLSKS